jgi:pyrroloquinoline quinone biosynthesis protein D
MAPFPENCTPSIHPMFRFQWEDAQDTYVLLYPEGMVKLSHSAAEILKHCDGEKTIIDIINDLNEMYPDANLDNDVISFIEKAVENGWLKI